MQRQCLAEAQPIRSPSIELAALSGMGSKIFTCIFVEASDIRSASHSATGRDNNRPTTEEAMWEDGWMELQRQQRRRGPRSRDRPASFLCASRRDGFLTFALSCKAELSFAPLGPPLGLRQGVGGMRSGPCLTQHPCKNRSNSSNRGGGASRTRPEQRSTEAFCVRKVPIDVGGTSVAQVVGLPLRTGHATARAAPTGLTLEPHKVFWSAPALQNKGARYPPSRANQARENRECSASKRWSCEFVGGH